MHLTDNCLVAAAETSAIASCTQKGWWLAGWRAMRPLSGVRAAHSPMTQSLHQGSGQSRRSIVPTRQRRGTRVMSRRSAEHARRPPRATLRSAVGDAHGAATALRSTLILALELDEGAQRPQRHEPWMGRHIMRIAPKPDQTHSQEGIHPAYTRLCHRVSGPRNTRRSVPPQPHVKREEAITSSLMLNACVSTCPMSMCGRCCKYQRTSASSSSMSSSLHVSRMAKQT
eukprot:scaffold32265_cov72-Phaeocystis_antarctica.AAC.4